MGTTPNFKIRPARVEDVPLILSLIRELADYEHLSGEVAATEADLRRTLFGERPYAETLIGELDGAAVGFALFFHNYSTFLAKPGIYLEDLYIKPAYRGKGFGSRMLAYIAALAGERNCGRFEWSVLDWNAPAIRTYEKLGAAPMKDWILYRLSGKALDKLADSDDPR